MCQALTFVNTNTNAYIGYAGWAAGSFSSANYNLTETPFGSAGNFTDQEIVSQCIVGTRKNATAQGLVQFTSGAGNLFTGCSKAGVIFMLTLILTIIFE